MLHELIQVLARVNEVYHAEKGEEHNEEEDLAKIPRDGHEHLIGPAFTLGFEPQSMLCPNHL